MATKEQKAEIEKLIERGFMLMKALRDVEQLAKKAPNEKERKSWQIWPPILTADIYDVMNKAIVLADKYYGIELPENALGEPRFDIDLEHLGQTEPVVDPKDPSKGKGSVKIGPKAFQFEGKPSADWLASTKFHELQGHCAVGYTTRKFTEKEKKGAKGSVSAEKLDKMRTAEPKIPNPEGEVVAYSKELEWAEKNGLSKKMLEDIKRRLKSYYDQMTEEKQREWKEKLPWIASFLPEGTNGFPKGYAMVAAASPVITSDLSTATIPTNTVLESAAQMSGFVNSEDFLALNAHLVDDDEPGFFKSRFEKIGLSVPAINLEETLMLLAAETAAAEIEKAANNWAEAGATAVDIAEDLRGLAAAERSPNSTEKAGDLDNESADEENEAFDNYTNAAKNWDKVAKLKEKAKDKSGVEKAKQSAEDARKQAKAAKQRAAEAHERAAKDFGAVGKKKKKAAALRKAAREREELAEL